MDDRFIRQTEAITENFYQDPILVVGCGAVGREVAVQLAAMGAKNIQLCDFDVVEPTNVTTQGYRKKDLGKPKVRALASAMKELDLEGDLKVQILNGIFDPADLKLTPKIVFSCPDNMIARRQVYEYAANTDSVELLVDGRMLGPNFNILANTRKTFPKYERSLFGDQDAMEGRCTNRSNRFCAAALASMLILQYSNYMRKLPLMEDTLCNMIGCVFIPMNR